MIQTFWYAGKKGLTVMYILTVMSLVADFVQRRVNKPIANTPAYQCLIGSRSREERRQYRTCFKDFGLNIVLISDPRGASPDDIRSADIQSNTSDRIHIFVFFKI